MKLLSLPNFSQLEKTHASYAGVIYAIINHLLFVTSNFIIQKTGKRLNTFQMLYGIGLLLLFFNFLMTKFRQVPICAKDIKITRMLIIRATIGPIGATLGIMGLTMISVSECTAIQMTSPAFTAILATLLLGEKYDKMLLLNSLFCFAGVVLIAKPAFIFGEAEVSQEYPYRSLGILITILGAFVASFVQIALKKLGSMVSPFVNTLHFALFLGPFMAVSQIIFGINPVELSDMLALAVIGVMHFGAHYLMNKSFSLGNTATISLMMYSQVFLAYIIDILYKGTQLDFYSVLGSISIFFCMFITLFRLRMNSNNSKEVAK